MRVRASEKAMFAVLRQLDELKVSHNATALQLAIKESDFNGDCRPSLNCGDRAQLVTI